jgi:hypothetical protein
MTTPLIGFALIIIGIMTSLPFFWKGYQNYSQQQKMTEKTEDNNHKQQNTTTEYPVNAAELSRSDQLKLSVISLLAGASAMTPIVWWLL